MKKIILTAILISATSFSFAQTAVNTVKSATSVSATPFEKVMSEKIAKLAQCQKPEDFTALANDFARIGAKEKNEWLPQYYAAFATIQKGRVMMREGKTAELDPIAEEAQQYLDASVALSPNNAENFILEKMIHSLKMLVNPMSRFMSEGALAGEALSSAEKLDPNNPRISLLHGEDAYFTPEQYGGSKEKGLELMKKSLEEFETYKISSAIAPNWGKGEADYFISKKP